MIDINIHAATRPEDFNPRVSWQETINANDYLTTSITLGDAPTCYLYLRPNQIVQLRAVLDEALERLSAHLATQLAAELSAQIGSVQQIEAEA